MPLVEIKDFNALIDNKPFFCSTSSFVPSQTKQKAYEKLTEMSKNDGYTTGNLLDLFVPSKLLQIYRYRFIKTKNTNIPQQINFTGKLEEDDGATMFFIAEKQQNYSKPFFKFISLFRIK